MMMAQPYNDRGDFGHFYYPQHPNTPTAAHYNRTTPYAYVNNMRHDLHQGYLDHHTHHAVIQEPDNNTQNDQPRRRIAVACARCRKRKIKCSGDLGDGSGCSACKASGSHPEQVCTFNRVGSNPQNLMRGVEMLPHNASVSGSSHSTAYSNDHRASIHSASGRHPSHSRTLIPTLHTRSSIPSAYDTQYAISPNDAYTDGLSINSRQDSVTSRHGLENYRSWNTTTHPMTTLVTTAYCEPSSAASFGTLQIPSVPSQPQTSYLPRLANNSLSPLNMSDMNISLPQRVYQRRLPIPPQHTLQHPQTGMSTAEVPEIRPLASYSTSTAHINGIHSPQSNPWLSDTTASPIRRGSMANFAPQSDASNITPQSTTVFSQPILEYQYILPPMNPMSSSPEVSPTSATTLSDSFHSDSSASPNAMPYPSQDMSTAVSVPLYSYSYSSAVTDRQFDTAERSNAEHLGGTGGYSTQFQESGNHMDSQADAGGYRAPISHLRSSVDYNGNAYLPNTSQGSLHQSQPQHATSIEALCRQSSNDQSQRPSTANRMSIAHFSSHY